MTRHRFYCLSALIGQRSLRVFRLRFRLTMLDQIDFHLLLSQYRYF
jgi:hypothetical protein